MTTVAAMIGVIWGIGALMGAPYRARWVMIAVLLLCVILLQIVLPDGHVVREATGGDPRLWLLIAAAGALIWAYAQLLRRIKTKIAASASDPESSRQFSDTELERYARHIVLREIGGTGQRALKEARVLVIGAGGLGAPALQYLAAAGVGTIGVIDDDKVDNSNLQRQVIHSEDGIGLPKVQSAKIALERLNPYVILRPYERRLDAQIARELIGDYDVILDGSDNFETRYLVNEACVERQTPLIGAALTQWEGQISVYDPAAGGPCYACVFPKAPEAGLAPSCAEAGVLGPLPGVVGSMMAVEAVKVIAGAGETLRGRMLIYDALYAQTRIISLKRDQECDVCGR